MRKRRNAFMVALIIVVLALACWFVVWPEPEKPTATPTKTATVQPPTSTATAQPPTCTATQAPTEKATETATPAPTFTETPGPSATPGPVLLKIHTGMDEGAAWFRTCPSVSCVSIYPLNAPYEGSTLIFRQTASPAGFCWVEVEYGGVIGYVYGDYVRPDVCRSRAR